MTTIGSCNFDIDRLFQAVNSLRKCLECTICLELMVAPIKTRCGHSFCQICIRKVLQKNAYCPLCKNSLQKRSISKDDHLEGCIQKFKKLLTAIQIDSHIDILSYSKQPYNTKESSNTGSSQSNYPERTKPPRKQSTYQSRRTSRSSTKRKNATNCDNSSYDTSASNKQAVVIKTETSKTDINADPNYKVRTWLHFLPDEPSTSTAYLEYESLQHNDNKPQANRKTKTKRSNNPKKKESTETRLSTSRLQNRKKSVDANETIVGKINLSQDASSSAMLDDHKRQTDVCDRSIVSTTNTSAIADKQPSASSTWSRVMEFGKEMRKKKKKVKKLNVSTERSTEKKKEIPRIIDDVVLSPKSRFDLSSKSMGSYDASYNKDINIYDLSDDSHSRKLDAIDKSVNLSGIKTTSSGALANEEKNCDPQESFTKSKIDAESFITETNYNEAETSYIMLAEGKRIRIDNLDSCQMRDIIGSVNVEEQCQLMNDANVSDKSRGLEENKKITAKHCRSPPSSWKKLIVLTPEKLNESMYKDKEIREVVRTPVRNFSDWPTCLSAKSRTPPANNNIEKTENAAPQTQFLTPNRPKLSLKKHVTNLNSLLLSPIPQPDSHHIKKSTPNRRGVDLSVSKNDPPSDRLEHIKRDLSSQIIDENRSQSDQPTATAGDLEVTVLDVIVRRSDARSTSRKSENIRSRTCDGQEHGTAVKFLQLGRLIKQDLRRNVKYYYLNKTKREQLMPARVPFTFTYNIQQSISKSDSTPRIGNNSRNFAVSPNPSNNSQDLDITVLENIRFTDNSTAHPAIALENMKLSTAFPTCSILASSTLKKDGDCRLNRKQAEVESSLVNADSERRSINKSLEGARLLCMDGNAKEISRDHSKGTSTLLSPNKDSQRQFLTINSPISQRSGRLSDSSQRRPVHVNPIDKDNKTLKIKNSQFTASSRSSESSQSQMVMKRKRKRQNIEMFDLTSRSDESSDSLEIFDTGNTMEPNRCKKKQSSNTSTNATKNRRLSSSQVENKETIRQDSKEQEAHERKFKRVRTIPNSDSEQELELSKLSERNNKRNKTDIQHDQRDTSVTSIFKRGPWTKQDSEEDRSIRNIVDKWTNEHNAMQRSVAESGNTQDSVKSGKCSSARKPASGQQLPLSNNSLVSGKRQSPTRSSQRNAVPTKSDLFDSNSLFDSLNLDQLGICESSKSSKSRKSGNFAFNDDIINKVLQIDRSLNNTGVYQSTGSARRNDRTTTQRGSNDKESNLLQDNFDEIIANVELPQSNDETLPRTEQPDRNLNRTLTEQNISSYFAMTDEPLGVTQEIPMKPASFSNDIFEDYSHPGRRPLSTTNISNNSDKENSVSCGQKKHEYGEDRKDKKNIAAKHHDVDKDHHRKITSKNNISHEERTFDRVDSKDVRVEKEINVSKGSKRSASQLSVQDNSKVQKVAVAGEDSNITRSNSSKYDTLMDVTQQQVQLQMFEEDLLGIPVLRTNRTKATEMISQNDPFQEQQQCTPQKRKQSARDKNVASEEPLADEDDVVEKTPETRTKTKTNDDSVKKIGSNIRRNIALTFSSPISNKAALPSTSTSSLYKKPALMSGLTPIHVQGIYPLYQSTPKAASSSSTAKGALTERDTRELSDGVSSPATLFLQREKSETPQNSQQRSESKRKLRFICSSLPMMQIERVRQFAQSHNAEFVSEFDADVTHVIVSTVGKDNVAKCTLKYLQGIAHQKWVVSSKWIDDCIKERKLLSEIPYEATSQACSNEQITGPRNSRLRDKGLFEDFAFLCVGPYNDVSSSQYQDLLRATGATVVDSLEALAVDVKNLKGVVIQDNNPDHKMIEHWYKTARAVPITIEWVVDCIMQYKLCSLASYNQALTPQDYYVIGYPRELVEDEDYSDMSP